MFALVFFFFSSRRRHTRFDCDWSSDVCSSDLEADDIDGRLQPGQRMEHAQHAGGAAHVELHLVHFSGRLERDAADRKSTRLNSSHSQISYAVFCLKKKKNTQY